MTNYTVKKINYKGAQIQTYEFGGGEHLVFCLPSFPQSGIYYEWYAEQAAHPKLKFVTLDLPGWAGWSEIPEQQNQSWIETYLDLIEHIVKSYEAEKISLLGYSFGTMLAYQTAAKLQEKVKRLVLVSPLIFSDIAQTSSQYKTLNRIARLKKYSYGQVPKLLKYYFFSLLRQRVKQLEIESSAMVEYLDRFQNAKPEIVFDSLVELFNYPHVSDIANLNEVEKVMVINSADEPELFRKQAEHLRRHLNNEKSVYLHGNHDDFMMKKQPEVAREIFHFLA